MCTSAGCTCRYDIAANTGSYESVQASANYDVATMHQNDDGYVDGIPVAAAHAVWLFGARRPLHILARAQRYQQLVNGRIAAAFVGVLAGTCASEISTNDDSLARACARVQLP